MGNMMQKISRAGLVLVLIGIGLLAISLGDTAISFREPKSFEEILEAGIQPGDHVSGQVPFLLDTFASKQTWTENTSTHSATPKKTSSLYYVLPAGEYYVGLTVHAQDFSAANDLVDQTYSYLNGGNAPTSELTLDTRVVEMDEELSAMFRDDLKEYYGYTDQELNDLKPFLMVEPRGFTAIRVFCGAGVAAILVGVILLVMRWRKISAQIRQSREEMPGPDLD